MNKPKLLYVDDEFVNLQLFKYNFQMIFELRLASSGAEALDIMKDENIAVIISDLKMPIMNGIELIDAIMSKYPNKKCLMLSAYSVAEAVNMGLDESKISSYISKPWKRDKVVKIINSAFVGEAC